MVTRRREKCSLFNRVLGSNYICSLSRNGGKAVVLKHAHVEQRDHEYVPVRALSCYRVSERILKIVLLSIF